MKVVERGLGKEVLYKIHSRGIYLVLETQVGLVLMWDRKTSIFIKLEQHYKVRPDHERGEGDLSGRGPLVPLKLPLTHLWCPGTWC